MEMFWTVAAQVAIMFLLMGAGFLGYKIRLISQEGADQLTTVLLTFVTPCVILDAYQSEPDARLLSGLVAAFAVSLGIHFFTILLVTVLIKKEPRGFYKSERFGVVFSNCGFMGFPLAEAVMGEKGILYASAMVAVFNLLQWTYGRALMEGKTEMKSFARSFLNPNVLAVALGLLMLFLKIRLPSVIGAGVTYLGAMNTPLGMLIIGTFIARSNFIKSLGQKRIYLISFLSLAVVPLLCLAVLHFLPVDKEVVLICLLLAACPCAANTAIFAHRYTGDGLYATNLVVVSTLISAVTIPLFMLVMALTGIV